MTAVQRFCHLLNEVTPGGIEIVGEVLDVAGTTPDSISVPVRTSRISMLLGRDFSSEEIRNLLTPIGFDVENTDSQDVQLVKIPSFRPDTETETDIAEEVARHYGYGKLGTTIPRSPDAGHLSPQQKLRRVMRQVMTGAGLIEAMPNPFLAPDDITKAALIVEEPVRLLNPLAVEESVLRPSLLPGLLTAVAYNYSHRNMETKLFETGPVFEASEDSSGLPLETEHLAALISNADAFEATSLLKDLASTLKLEFQLTNVDGLAGLHPTRGAMITIGDTEVGSLGEVDPAVLRSYEIEERCAWLNLRLDLVIEAAISVEGVPYQPVSTFPSSDVDLAFAVGEQVQASEIEMTLRKAAGQELQSLHLFDVFRSGQLDEGVRSLAFSMRLQAKDKTLTDEEVGVVRQRCIEAVESAYPASLRA